MKNFNFLSIIFLITVTIFSCKNNDSSYEVIQIDKNWTFTQVDHDDFKEATVPGCVHADLYANKIIPDPFKGKNEINMKWVGENAWHYTTTFNVQKDFFSLNHTELIFEGLDTYALVFLNDEKIIEADNMYRTWEVDCKSNLCTGENKLDVYFYSPVYHDSLAAMNHPIKLPDSRAYTRKAPYQYGWDWGPEFVTMGIWKPVYLRAWNNFIIGDVYVQQKSITNNLADLSMVVTIQSDIEETCHISILDKGTDLILKASEIELLKGNNNYQIDFQIKDPVLWWTNGLGEPHLYNLELEFEINGKSYTKYENMGVRTLELVQDVDSIGESFYFRLNGEPIFMKGANYIPQNSFPTEVSKSDYEKVIKSAVDANMNMLRVWGGGIYEDDYFYDLCDQNGILIWQDFMFACNMYPGDSGFLLNVKQEVIDQVKRIRNHSCLALWCGNNEVNEGWFNWGWQNALNYSKEDSISVWKDYQMLFENLIPSLVNEYNPSVSYWPSSPKTGWGHDEAKYSGDMHYWGVWWGEEPFEIYEDKVGRFMTEYGFQGFPHWKTVQSFTKTENLKIDHENFLNHQKHPRGMELIQTYMERDYPVPDNLFDYAYVSQLVQAEGVSVALEAHRRAKPYCMGTLYWQLNDCWPVISWSSVDFEYRWKALHYFVREIYDEVMISIHEENTNIQVDVVSDLLKDEHGVMNIVLMDFYGDTLYHKVLEKMISANISEMWLQLSEEIIQSDFDEKKVLFHAKLEMDDNRVFEKIYYFVSPKELTLPECKVLINIDEEGNLELTSDVLAKNVYLFHEDIEFFEKNYFDLLPKQVIAIQVVKNVSAEEINILTLN